MNVHGVILAGGKSRRMGRDKAILPWFGKPLIEHLADRLKEVCHPVTVVTGTTNPYSFLNQVQFAADDYPGYGPLAGIHAGLRQSPHDYSFVMACDMPYFSLNLYHEMATFLNSADAILVPGEPFHGFYHRRLIPLLEEELEQGNLTVKAFLNKIKVTYVPASAQDRFVNLNFPEDYEEATNKH